MHFCQILSISSLKATSSPKFQQWSYFWRYIVHEKKILIFFLKTENFRKIFLKNFTKFHPNLSDLWTSLRCINYENLSLWIKNFFKIFENTSCYFLNRICNKYQKCCFSHVSESRPTYFWLDELNSWLLNLLYYYLRVRTEPFLKVHTEGSGSVSGSD